MGALQEFKKNNPSYANVPDDQMAYAIYKKHYSGKMPLVAYTKKLGLSKEQSLSVLKIASGKGEKFTFGNLDKQALSKFPVTARANEFMRGSMLGSYYDEGLGAVFGEGAKQGSRDLSGAMQRERPKETLGLNLAGGLTEAAALALGGPVAAGTKYLGPVVTGASNLISKAIGSGGRVAQVARGTATGAAVGAGAGGVYGFGEGIDTASRFEEGSAGAKIGAIVGSGLGAAAPLAREAAENVISLFRRSDIEKISKEFGISKPAANVIKQTFDQGGDINAARLNLERAGSQAMLADAGEAAQALTDAAAASGQRASQTMRTAIDGRVTRSSAKVRGALDKALGEANDPEALRRGILQGSQAERKAAYDKAFGQEIDWFSPDGEALRQLIATTPRDVLSDAKRSAGMAARGDVVPNYSAEFEPEIYFPNGPKSPDTKEAAEIDQFFEAYKAMGKTGYKRPLTEMVKGMGGIDPKGRAAEELRQLGVTPQTHVGLFRNGGMKELDNLEASNFSEGIRFNAGDDNYADPNDLYEALVSEGQGRAVGFSDDAARNAEIENMEYMLPEYEARRDALAQAGGGPTAPDVIPSNPYPVETVSDVDQIKRSLDQVYRTNDKQGLLGGQTDYGRLAGIRATETRELLKRAAPGYAEALRSAADPLARKNAVDMGQKILRTQTTRDEISEFVRRAEKPELYAAQAGLRGQIDERMANVRAISSDSNMDARQALAALSEMSSDASRAKISMILGDEAPELFAELDEATQSFGLRAALATNSKSAARIAGKQSMDEVAGPNMAELAMQGETVNTTKALIQAVTGYTAEFTTAKRQKVYQDIAFALTNKTGDDARMALNVLDAAMKGQELTSAQTDNLAKIISGVLFTGGQGAITKGAAADQRNAQ